MQAANSHKFSAAVLCNVLQLDRELHVILWQPSLQVVEVLVSADDDSLETWVKQKEPMIAVPPPDMKLVGWRDPYIFETINEQGKKEWGMLLGSGIKGQGGSVMIYRSKSLRAGSFLQALNLWDGSCSYPWLPFSILGSDCLNLGTSVRARMSELMQSRRACKDLIRHDDSAKLLQQS